nr:alpha/beta hydrolase [Nakamurella flavida]
MLAVIRKPATDQSTRIGSAVFNPGGPGGSGVDIVAQFGAFGVGGDLNRRFDLVGFDPRGVGASLPVVTCQTGAERDADRAASVRLATDADVQAADARAEAFAQACTARTGEAQGIDGATFLGTLGTRDVVRDMDVLRAALGDNKLTYVGFSYGTLLGTIYAEQFGGNVRAMVLDGAVDPVQDPAESNLDQAKGFQSAFDSFAASCAQQPGCVLGTDPAQASAVFQSLTRPLLDTPLPLADGRVLTYSDALTGTIQAMYSETFWTPLSEALLSLSQGKGDQLMALADAYLQRDAQGGYSSLQDAFTAIGCMDNPREDDPQEQLALIAESNAAAPFADSGEPPLVTRGPCDFWPADPTLVPHVPEVPGLAPVLVISTTGDPATPYQAGVDLAEQLGGRLLTVEGTRHTAYLSAGITCVDDAATQYLTDLTLPADGTTCS